MGVNWRVWTRKGHRWGAILVALPFRLVIVTGILLQLKKEWAWVQPPTLRGQGKTPTVTREAILEAARSVPEAGVESWQEVDRLDIVECAARPLIYRGRTPRPDLFNDQGQGWIDSEGAFSLDGANADGSVQRQGPVLTPRAIHATNDNEPYSFHSGGANMLFADGHMLFVRETVTLEVFAALCTRAAGEVADSTTY